MESAHVTGHPYQLVAGRIAGKIDAGDLRPGDKLPSVRALAKDNEVSAMTAQKALGQLVVDGYAEAVSGLGYFVTEPQRRNTEQAATVESINRQLDDLQATVATLADRVQRLEDGAGRS